MLAKGTAEVFRRVGVEVVIIGHVEDALVDAEQVLGLGGVVDVGGRPDGAALVVVDVEAANTALNAPAMREPSMISLSPEEMM
jgi:hypothetical protein